MGFAFHPASHACLSVLADRCLVWVRVGKPNGGPSCFASRAVLAFGLAGGIIQRASACWPFQLAVPVGLFQLGCSGCWFGIGPSTQAGFLTVVRGEALV
jgi:hypothetical protein